MSLMELAFYTLPMDTLLEKLLARSPDATFAYVVTPNVDHLERLRRDPALRPHYEDAWLCLFDSRFLAKFLGFLGQKPPPVITGADLVAALLPRLSGQRVAVVGMTPTACASLQARFPALHILHHNPPMGLADNLSAQAEAVQFVRQVNAAFVFLAVGSPVQETLAHALWCQGHAKGIGLCVGAAMEFAAGTQRRAPLWMRHAGLECLYRLAREPRRLAWRYCVRGPLLLWVLWRQKASI